MLERILVPLDGSTLAEKVLIQVRQLLLHKDAEVVLLRVVAVPPSSEADVMEVAELYYDLADRLQITHLLDRIIELPRTDRWSSMARAAIRE